MRWPVPCLLLLLVCGCVAPTLPTPDPATLTSPVAPTADAGHLEDEGCDEYHAFYPTPGTFFEKFVPTGFRLAYTDPANGLISLSFSTQICSGASILDPTRIEGIGAAAATWVSVPVLVPERFADPSVAQEWVPIEVDVSVPRLAALFQDWQLANVTHNASFDRQARPGPVQSDDLQIRLDGGSYDQQTIVPVSESVFAKGAARFWTVGQDGSANGFVTSAWNDAKTIGVGSASLVFQGDPLAGAPPVSPGYVHQVTGASHHWMWTPT